MYSETYIYSESIRVGDEREDNINSKAGVKIERASKLNTCSQDSLI